ncbi:MAG: hypothetical protein ACFFEF_11030 [Candidatus Thorarchaeota archaeon]
MSKEKLKNELTKKQKTVLRSAIADDLAKQNLTDWQNACKSFGPFNYEETTRKMWFEKNKNRVPTGRKILAFVDKWSKTLRDVDALQSVSLSAIRNDIVEAIREEEDRQGLGFNKLNTFKLATFKTLVSWADHPSKLEEGPYEGQTDLPADKKKRPVSRKGRKSIKGIFGPPGVNLVKSYEMVGSKAMNLQIAIINNYLHPYQNVNLELQLDSKLKVKSVGTYGWSPADNQIKIGFIPSSLDKEPLETIIMIEIEMTTPAKSYSIDGIIHYDNTDKGIPEKSNLKVSTIKI